MEGEDMEDEYGDEVMYDGNTTVEESSAKKSAAQARAERYSTRMKGEPVVELAPPVKRLKLQESPNKAAQTRAAASITKSVPIKTKAQEAAEEEIEEPMVTKRIRKNDGTGATVTP